MAELKPGGLAIVIGGHLNKILIGRTVELVSVAAAETMIKIPGQPSIWNEYQSRWLIRKDGLRTTLSNYSVVQGFGLILPQHLLPIDGDDFQYEDERQRELTHG